MLMLGLLFLLVTMVVGIYTIVDIVKRHGLDVFAAVTITAALMTMVFVFLSWV